MIKKHVIHLITEPSGGGAEIMVRQLNSKLPNYGISSSILFLKNTRQINLEDREECLGLVNQRSLYAPIKLYKYLSQYDTKTTILHGHLVDAQYLLSIPFVAKGFTKFYTEHSTKNKRRDIKIFKPIEKIIYKNYKKIICVSDGVKNELMHWLDPKSNLYDLCKIYNGSRLFIKANQHLKKSQKLNFISVGSLKKEKGFEVAIKAFSKVKDLDFEYLIIGDGSERYNLEKLIFKLGLENKIFLLGNIGKDLYLHYWNADLQIIPSLSEGFGIVAIEGMSAGLPLIVANVIGLSEVAGFARSTRYFESGSIDQLATLIIDSFINYKKITLLAHKEVEVAKLFTIDIMAENYSKLYKQNT